MNIICMKWGNKFSADYVNWLYSMVTKNLDSKFRFVYFTENIEGIRPEVETQELPELELPPEAPERGWRELTVFKKNFGGLSGPTFFLDLVVVIFGKYARILNYFEKNSEKVKNVVHHEQTYLSREIDKLGGLEYWPDEWVPSFKYKCCPSWLKSWFVAPSIPLGAKIILFHGLPNPSEAIIGQSGKLYRHIQPSPWIKDYWINNE